MKTRRSIIWGVTGLGAFTVWRLREQGQLEDRFIEEGVSPAIAASATSLFLPFWSFLTYTEVANEMGDAESSEWIAYAEETTGVIQLL